MKQCNVCEKIKPIECFEWAKNRPNPRKTCKTCRSRKYNKPEKYQRSRLKNLKDDPRYFAKKWEKSTYGVTREDFSYSHCWICGSTEKLCIDHCHSTNKVRGILCSSCNFAIGNFHDSIYKLERAIMYLKNQPHFEVK